MCVCVWKVLDGSESQYSGMQIGTLQDEEEEGGAPAPEEPLEPFAQSVLGMCPHQSAMSMNSIGLTRHIRTLPIPTSDCSHSLMFAQCFQSLDERSDM